MLGLVSMLEAKGSARSFKPHAMQGMPVLYVYSSREGLILMLREGSLDTHCKLQMVARGLTFLTYCCHMALICRFWDSRSLLSKPARGLQKSLQAKLQTWGTSSRMRTLQSD